MTFPQTHVDGETLDHLYFNDLEQRIYNSTVHVGPTPTGNAATDTANLQAAINATPTGGKLVLPSGVFHLNDALTIPRSMTIDGSGAHPGYQSKNAGGDYAYPTATPKYTGTVLYQETAAKDGIRISASALSVNIKDLVIQFQSGLASTGDGINARPTEVRAPGHDMGLTDFRWDNIHVFDHDANHYGFAIMNMQYGTLVNLRAYGGGCLDISMDNGGLNGGNLVIVHPVNSLSKKGGTANGYNLTAVADSGNGGVLNLITFIRPQIIYDMAAYDGGGTSICYNDRGGAKDPQNVSLVDPDFEGFANTLPVFGTRTSILGNPLISGCTMTNPQVGSMRLGQEAGGAMDLNANGNTCLGVAAGFFTNTNEANALTTGTNNTFVGNQAGSYSGGTLGQATAVGMRAWVGQNGTAVGYTAKATTDPSAAFGQGAQATSGITSAIGPQTTASGGGATAVGGNSTASGGNSVALGRATTASAAGSVAIGCDSTATGVSTAVQNQIALGTANHHILLKTAAAPADASLAANQFTFWLDPTNGAAKLMIKAKQADGTVKTAAVALA